MSQGSGSPQRSHGSSSENQDQDQREIMEGHAIDASHSASQSESGSGSDSDSDGESFVLPDPLATGREKRQTAGNKLREMLNAELEADELFAEDPDDDDFGSDQDKQNDHDSELDSTSDEDQANAEAEDAGEKALQKQEKLARSRKRKANVAFAKPSKPAAQAPVRVDELKKEAAKQRRLQKLAEGPAAPQSATRQSSRSHAVKVASKVERKLKEEAERKARASPVVKAEEHIMTQEERLARAKEMEVINMQSLNKLEKYEEERKAAQKLLARRRKHTGPVLRYLSTSRIPSDDTTDSTADTRHVTSLLSFQNLTETYQQQPLIKRIFDLDDNTKPEYPAKSFCHISGQPARYRDPESGIPYATKQAFDLLQKLKADEIPWNPTLSMYIHNPLGEVSPPSTPM